MPLDWIVPDWPIAPHIGAFITSRNGGTSSGAYGGMHGQGGMNLGMYCGDERARVLANRELLSRWLPQAPSWMRQVHGCQVIEATQSGQVWIERSADAAVARTRGTVCVVQAADCMPILLGDASAKVVAIAHAGWRGLATGVIEATVAAMGIAPDRIMAFLGPAIGREAFEVGLEVKTAFSAHDADANFAFQPCGEHKWLADLEGLARLRLDRAGVKNVFGGGRCTVRESNHFYSYRRDKVTGRMAAFIWLK